MEEITNVSDWNVTPDLRAIKGTIYCAALRCLLYAERNETKASGYVREMTTCLDEILRLDGYLGFVMPEAVKVVYEISRKIRYIALDYEATQVLVKFVDSHLFEICNVHRDLSIDDDAVQRFVDLVKTQADRHGLEGAGHGLRGLFVVENVNTRK